MRKELQCIMLIDDDPDDNFIHERVISKSHVSKRVIAMEKAKDALAYLTSEKNTGDTHPDLIFLDINMPAMNGWEFLEAYNKLNKSLQSHAVVVMLTTSDNPDDKLKAKSLNIASDFKTKPLTPEMLDDIIGKYF